MYKVFNDKFTVVAKLIDELDNNVLAHTPSMFYKLGQKIDNLPLKSTNTKLVIEQFIANHDYARAKKLLNQQIC